MTLILYYLGVTTKVIIAAPRTSRTAPPLPITLARPPSMSSRDSSGESPISLILRMWTGPCRKIEMFGRAKLKVRGKLQRIPGAIKQKRKARRPKLTISAIKRANPKIETLRRVRIRVSRREVEAVGKKR